VATLDRAVQIAAAAHYGQVDRYGAPYILHPIRTMMAVNGENAKIAAILHDVVEDSDWEITGLKKEGFSDPILAAVDALTRRDSETYGAYIERLLPNELARTVKIADLQDNMDLKRAHRLTADDAQKFVRNHRAWLKLTTVQSGKRA
jgi:(p)ppGpp synthase/HD superfamily hydrolase